MPLVRAYADIPNPRVQRKLRTGEFSCRTGFFDPPEDKHQDAPVAFLAEGQANRVAPTHFHSVDQFQVIYRGDGTLGAHRLMYGGVHFARAYTPYGPIRNGKQGLGFITLRAHCDPGAQYLRDHREDLEKVPNRHPWQTTAMPEFKLTPGESGVAVKAIDGLKDDRGLAGLVMVMKAGTRAIAPDPSRGDGQYILVMKGGIIHESREKKGLAIIWVGKHESAFELVAGPEGCEVLVLDFPAPGGANAYVRSQGEGRLKAHQCVLCAFIYDEAAGLPEAGIAPGTRWPDVPDDFICPDCEATKADFEIIAV